MPPAHVNFIWADDFVLDAKAGGEQIKCLTVADQFTRECLAIDVKGSIRSRQVIEVLSRLVSAHGAPRYLRSDNVLRTEASNFVDNRHPARAFLAKHAIY